MNRDKNRYVKCLRCDNYILYEDSLENPLCVECWDAGRLVKLGVKVCMKEYQRAYYAEHGYECSVAKAENYKKNREALLKRATEYYYQHREAVLAREKLSYAERRLTLIKRSSEYYYKHREEILDKKAKQYSASR